MGQLAIIKFVKIF